MIILIAALILLSGFFSLFEQALKTAGKPHLHAEAAHDEKQGYRRRLFLKAAEDSDRYLMAARFWRITLRTFAAVISGMVIQSAAPPVFLSAAVCAAVLIGVMLLLDSLIFRVTRHAAEGIAAAVFPFF